MSSGSMNTGIWSLIAWLFVGNLPAQTTDHIASLKRMASNIQNYKTTFVLSNRTENSDKIQTLLKPNESASRANCLYMRYNSDEVFIQDGNSKMKLSEGKFLPGQKQVKAVELDGLRSLKYLASGPNVGTFDSYLRQFGMFKDVPAENREGPTTPLDLVFIHNRIYRLLGYVGNSSVYRTLQLGTKKIAGVNMNGLSIDDIDLKVKYDLWFDDHESGLPRYAEIFASGALVGRYQVLSFREIAKTSWITEEYTLEMRYQGLSTINHIRVDQFEILNEKPANFSITLPAGTSIADAMAKKSFRLQQDEAISPQDLPELLHKASTIEPNSRVSRAIEHTGQKSSLLFWILGSLGLLLLGYGGFRWFRSRRRV